MPAGKADDICAIVYTLRHRPGRPKGALHSYRSLMAGSRRFCEPDGLSPKDDLVSSLPPAWITEQWLAFGCHLLSGGTVNFAESAETQQEDIAGDRSQPGGLQLAAVGEPGRAGAGQVARRQLSEADRSSRHSCRWARRWPIARRPGSRSPA